VTDAPDGRALPRVSFVIPVRPGAPAAALESIVELDYPREQIEVLIARGHNPSAQRNAAIQHASGEIVYFLDDDSTLETGALRQAVDTLSANDGAGVGGPVLTHSTNTPFQLAIGRALGSPFGLGPFCNRYRVHGELREAGERELSSANLAVRRTVFAQAGYFDERMFGNEENEWINRAGDQGARFFYHPRVRCFRDQRRDLWAVCRQHFHYGRGRGRHLWLHRRAWSWSVLAPLCLVLSPGLLAFPPWGVLPLLFYGASVVIAASITARGDWPMAASLCAIFPALHLPYGTGIIWGLVDWLWRKDRSTSSAMITVETPSPAGGSR